MLPHVYVAPEGALISLLPYYNGDRNNQPGLVC